MNTNNMQDQRQALSSALSERFGESFTVPPGLPHPEQLLDMARWSSHRSFSTRPVDADSLRVLAGCALSAPTKSYLQQADIIEVRDPARRKAVEQLVPSMPWMSTAPVLLIFCGNGRRFRRLFGQRGQTFTNEHLDGFFNPTVDASLVMMNFIRAAACLGLVSCPISVLRDRAAELADILKLPDHVFPVAGLVLGYPDQARSISPRLPLQATLHVDAFNDQHGDALIESFDERYVKARAAVLKGNKAAPPQPWSEEKVRQYASAQRDQWGQFVRAKKFDLS